MKYLKKLNPQELGFRKGILRTGGYFYISKKAANMFFGSLSKHVNNDNKILKISSLDKTFKIAEMSYVYHNDKWNTTKGSRDEYRIYLNRQIQFHALHFMPNDIVVFERDDDAYSFLHLKENDKRYQAYLSLLDVHGINGNHAIIRD